MDSGAMSAHYLLQLPAQLQVCRSNYFGSDINHTNSAFFRSSFTGWTLRNRHCHQSPAVRRSGMGTIADGSKPGFGPRPVKKSKKTEETQRPKQDLDPIIQAQQILAAKQQSKEDSLSTAVAEEAPTLVLESSVEDGVDIGDEKLFEQRLEAIRRSAREQQMVKEQKKYGPIDYDAPPPIAEQSSWTNNLTTRIGVGVAVLVLGAVFTLGDILPSGSPNGEADKQLEQKQLPPEVASKLKAQVQEFEELLKSSPEDRAALEGAGVTYAELGEFKKAATYLVKLTQKESNNVEALRLLGEVQYETGEYESSAAAYRNAIRVFPKESVTLLQGLTSALLANSKPSEAVGELLAARARINSSNQTNASVLRRMNVEDNVGASPGAMQKEDLIDPVQVELLLGKSYYAWGGHSGDAIAVYDALIASHPEDFRGYLAKGILLKEQGRASDAERMFIQARYVAPTKLKSLVDRYSGR